MKKPSFQTASTSRPPALWDSGMEAFQTFGLTQQSQFSGSEVVVSGNASLAAQYNSNLSLCL
ncbi:hypothetical protein NEIFLAOT_01372 [Neisseria flavescens NRL30031/H210]|uniref:Uncharacterized protein n=1 Tax=Neisseria flavescens NRL30031/H210 TaxID=546264 RepID=C0EN39_NEIFL|nr:hypothetical protein NEIFLAOT_01372 [Neisseria flavescens NRL30031/H210]